MSNLELQLDSSGLFSEALEYAKPSDTSDLSDVQSRHAEWTDVTPRGPIHSGYRRQILASEGLAESQALANQLRAKFDSMLVLGIGGSALGARAVQQALLWRTPLAQRRRVHIADNLDPIEFEQILAPLDLARTCVVIITKSGATLETMAQASVVFARLEAKQLKVADHVVAITDPQSGHLRKWAKREKLMSLNVPSDVGGRFSVFTPVGLLPLAFAGVDIGALLRGAQDQLRGSVIPLDQSARLALRLAELESAGYNGHVLMPYATVLKDFAAWFVQLWGESLGKVSRNGSVKGSLPCAAVGATDQHSLLQYLMEGPACVVNGFVRVQNWNDGGFQSAKMSALPAEFSGLNYAQGRSLGDILNGEASATLQALKTRQRPVYEIHLRALTPTGVGALLAFYMDLVTMCAAALDVNPYDQPGVELGKQLLPGLLKDLPL
ncbi:MAG: hypothetical protein JST16_15370 [Bdellovibrionales bacterium]|nr:hypothetical protein [Bdellovibrionales bacterium]